MNKKNVLYGCLLTIMLAVLASCGGGSVGGSGATVAEGGIGGTGISNGPITGFGSIFVNGVEYDTRNAEILVEGVNVGTGDSAVLNNLAVGKVVTVEGSIPSGTQGVATRVHFNDNVEGPLQNITVIDANTRELTVMGQTVIANTNTQFANTTLGSLAIDNQLEVSGLVTDTGAIQATFIEKKLDTFSAGGAVEVKGTVNNLDTLNRTFTIGAVQVSYAGGTDLSGLSTPLANGDNVEVKGIFSGGILLASLIETEEDLYISATTQWLEIEGYVTSVLSTTDFVINNQTVHTTANTRYVGGTASDLIVGARIEVEGTLSDGLLIATEIQYRDDVAIEAKVASVGTDSLTLVGFTGLTVTADARTEIDGAAHSLAEISSGRFVKILGRWSAGANTVLATKIEVETPSSTIEVKLRGTISSASNPFVSLLGATFDTTGMSYRNASGASLAAAQFFAQLTQGTPVYLQGVQNNATNTLIWTRISLRAP